MPHGWKLPSVLVLALCVGGLLAGCQFAKTPTPTTPVVMQLNWLHYGPFSGLYAAEANGYYASEGLKVAFQPGGADVDYITPVIEGKAQFGIAGADDLMLARAAGKPVQVIAVILRRSPLAFVAPASAGIRRPTDLIGKTVRITPQSRPVFLALMARVGVTPDQYTVVNLPSDPALFATGAADVWSVYVNSFAVTLDAAGHQLSFIYPEDYGIHFYSDAIFTTDQIVSDQPELALRFLRATLKGYDYIVQNPATAGALTAKHNAGVNPALENAKMLASLPLINTGEDHIGWMNVTSWAGMETTLRTYGVLTEPLSIANLYTTEFLEEIYGR